MTEAWDEKQKRLVSAVKKGERLLAGYAWHLLKARGYDPIVEDIEDLLGDSYIVAVTKLQSDPNLEIQSPLAWFRKILFFQCLRLLGKKKVVDKAFVRRLESEDRLLQILQPGSSPSPETVAIGRDFLAKLPMKERRILEGFAAGYTSPELAKEFNQSSQAIRKTKSRTLLKLQKLLTGEST